jgi:putative ABC transport system permease protein
MNRRRRSFWPVSIDREVDDEIAAHIALQTRRYMDAGMSEADARRAATARFGDVDQIRDELHHIRTDMETDMRRAELREEMRMDAEFAVRTLRRSPLFAAVAVFTIAVAIGANTAIFSVLNAVLLKSLPYRHADRVEMIWNQNGDGIENQTAVSIPEYFDLRDQLRAHDAVAAIRTQPSALGAEGGEPERLNAYVVSPNLFELLGASPLLGRSFGGDDGVPGGLRVIVLSHALWTRRFGADPTILGRTVSLAGFQRTIVGVMPPGVRFPDAPLGFLHEPADVWIPTTFEPQRADSRGNQIAAVIARRSPGVSDAQAKADLDAVAARWRVSIPDRYAAAWAKNWRLASVSVRDQMVGSVRVALFVIAGAVGLVLLIACVNVANLLLARGATRNREIGIRMALGAGRGRLVRQLLTESVVLSIAGGALGLFLAWAGVRLLVRLDGGQLPRLGETRIDLAVLAFTLGLSVVTGIVVGLFPALQQSARDLRGALSESSRGASDGRGRHRLRVSLVIAQVAMALVVLIGAGLLARSFAALTRVNPGFSPEHVITAQLTLPRNKYDSTAKVIRFYEQLVSQAAALPGVAAASGGHPIPMSSEGWSGSFRVEGEPDGPNDPSPHAEYGVAMPGYFRTMGIPLVAGREFESTDARGTPQVAIVDEVLAKQHWPNQSAIGKRINANGPRDSLATIVGIVGHVRKSSPQSEGEGQIYLPHAQSPQGTLNIVLRSKGTAASLAQPLRGLVKSLDSELPVSRMESLETLVSRSLARERFNTMLLGVFGLAALLLASVGLYGVMAYLVSQRTREIGIRMALGGEPAAIRGMVLREGLIISIVGLVIGTAVSFVAAKSLRGLLFGVTPTDAATYVGIGSVLLLVAAIATYGPARRATRVDPLTALRE